MLLLLKPQTLDFPSMLAIWMNYQITQTLGLISQSVCLQFRQRECKFTNRQNKITFLICLIQADALEGFCLEINFI